MLPDLLRPGVRVVIAGTIAAWDQAARIHYYDSPGNKFWVLLHESGLVPEPLGAQDDERVLDFGVGLTDMVRTRVSAPGEPPVFDRPGFERKIRRAAPLAVAFVSKTAANSYARNAGVRLVRDFGAPSWSVARVPAFVLPGPSGKLALDQAVAGFRKTGTATKHDVVVSGELARVLTGGDTDIIDTVKESRILDLERESFLRLLRTPGTLARIEHMLETGKPLRN